MKRTEQAALIRAYCKGLKERMLSRLPYAPEEWDGRHLRNWFWMSAHEQYHYDMGKKEMKSIKNEIIVRDL